MRGARAAKLCFASGERGGRPLSHPFPLHLPAARLPGAGRLPAPAAVSLLGGGLLSGADVAPAGETARIGGKGRGQRSPALRPVREAAAPYPTLFLRTCPLPVCRAQGICRPGAVSLLGGGLLSGAGVRLRQPDGRRLSLRSAGLVPAADPPAESLLSCPK